MSPRTVVFVVGPSRLRAFGVSTPCIFRILLSSADSLRMSPRIRRIYRRALSFPGLRGFNTLYISYLPVFGRFAADVSANQSYFCCPVRTPRVRRPVCGHPGEPFPSLDPDCFYGSSPSSRASASGPFRGIPAPFFRPFAAARSPYLCGTAAPFSRLQSVPMRNTPRSLRRFCYPVRNPHVRGSSESCRDVPCSRGTTPRCVLP